MISDAGGLALSLPAILNLFVNKFRWRMAGNNAVVRRAVEAEACAQIVSQCSQAIGKVNCMLTAKDQGRVMTMSFWIDFLRSLNLVKGKRVGVLAALIALTLAGIGVAFTGRRLSRPGTSSLTVTPAFSSSQNPNGQKRPVESVMITLRTFGFEPQEITRMEGRFFIRVENASGFREINLRLDREAGPRLKDVHLPKGKIDWKDVIDLTPGVYLLTEANNPKWVCRITVTPR
jgi:hypothetical protein